MLDITIWKEEIRKLSDLRPNPKNPRKISKTEFEKLKDRIKRIGLHERIIINSDNMMASGHQKYKALKECGVKEVPVLVAPSTLTEKEFDEVVISANLHSGVWDYDILGNEWDALDVIEYGLPPELLIGEVVDEEKPQVDLDPSKSVCDKCGKVV